MGKAQTSSLSPVLWNGRFFCIRSAGREIGLKSAF